MASLSTFQDSLLHNDLHTQNDCILQQIIGLFIAKRLYKQSKGVWVCQLCNIIDTIIHKCKIIKNIIVFAKIEMLQFFWGQ